MSDTPFEKAGDLRIGAVGFVSPDEIRVTLDSEAPESVSLNAGYPRPFPRVNGYLIIQVDDAFLVGQIQSLTVERAPFPKRNGPRDLGFIDLPHPLRQLKLNPLGILRNESDEEYIFQRGSESLPSVGAAVLLPTKKQLYAIVESGKNRRVRIGTSPIAGDAEVRVDPDRLFGRHLAVLGNTGSGKSCSVAGLIRWSLEAAKQESKGKQPNARFIILDPNGEYSKAFKDDDTINARIFKVEPDETGSENALKVPLWFWNSEEWCAFAQASVKTQRPALIRALQMIKGNPNNIVNMFLGAFIRMMRSNRGIDFNDNSPKGKFLNSLQQNWENVQYVGAFDDDQKEKLQGLFDAIAEICLKKPWEFGEPEFTNILQLAEDAFQEFGGGDPELLPTEIEAPQQFTGEALLASLEAASKELKVSEHTETLRMRVKALLSDTWMNSIIGENNDESDTTLINWLEDYIGSNNAQNGCISIIDLSLVPTQIIHVVTAVIARMVFEALQRYMKLKKGTLPTVLVMEEAHTFVKRYKQDTDIENYDAASACCQVFERIAREGRKFGLGLVISSQRPSEISPTVLSQCNTFLLHRISNDLDQERVKSLVPDNLRDLLRELPLLPSQRAVLLGWASELPVLVKMRDLPYEHQPQSDDPEIWDVWTHTKQRGVNWDEIANKWQGIIPQDQSKQGNNVSVQQGSEGQEEDNGDSDATDHIQNEPNSQDGSQKHVDEHPDIPF